MGCFNGTCGITNLPITVGTKVRGFILVPNHNSYGEKGLPMGSGQCYSTDSFVPLSIGIRGEYDDYGCMENIVEDTNTKLILKHINKQIKDGKLKLTERDEKPKIFKNIKELLNAICCTNELGFMMVIEDMYIAAIEAVEANRDEQYDQDGMLKNLIEDFKIAKKYLREEDAKNGLKNTLKNFNIKSAKNDFNLVMASLMRYNIPKRANATRHYAENVATLFVRNIGSYNLIESKFSLENGSALIKAKDIPAKMLAGHYNFHCFMSQARKSWMPQSGQGSQSDEYKVYRLMAEATLKYLKDIKDRHTKDVPPEDMEYFDKRY